MQPGPPGRAFTDRLPPLVPTDGVVADPGLFGAELMQAGEFYLLTFNNGDNRGHPTGS
jgi:hypothetical protein